MKLLAYARPPGAEKSILWGGFPLADVYRQPTSTGDWLREMRSPIVTLLFDPPPVVNEPHRLRISFCKFLSALVRSK